MNVTNYVKKNLPTILTCAGAVGVVTTSIAAVKGRKRYEELMEKYDGVTTTEYVKICVDAYSIPVFSGLATMACIFGANKVSLNREATITSAYVLLDSQYKQYRNKVVELCDEGTDKDIMTSIAQEEIEHYDIQKSFDADINLYYDPISNQYFEMSEADLLKAQYDLNRYLMKHRVVELNRFYEKLNIDQSDYGSIIGWCTKEFDRHNGVEWIEIEHVPMQLEDGLICYMLGYQVEPSIQHRY